MPRTDVHLDGMLRHLGAAYYESLHGRATRADVLRALDTVEDHLNEQHTPGSGTGIRPNTRLTMTGLGCRIRGAGPAGSAT